MTDSSTRRNRNVALEAAQMAVEALEAVRKMSDNFVRKETRGRSKIMNSRLSKLNTHFRKTGTAERTENCTHTNSKSAGLHGLMKAFVNRQKYSGNGKKTLLA